MYIPTAPTHTWLNSSIKGSPTKQGQFIIYSSSMMTCGPSPVPEGGRRDMHPAGVGGPEGLRPTAGRGPACPQAERGHRGPPQHPQDQQPQVHREWVASVGPVNLLSRSVTCKSVSDL